ncbi:hypothetical protein SB861_47515 [Paraburkholderia sp. SIMBA_049]|uniref:Periplasmic sensor hybrid histidine kinase n=1 Tax=Paraburkholderia hospita TaxID=169430 RepID=A0ABP2PBZ7_9BURK|nr:hypothetical protein [Paraburkholderia hospita]EIM94737.1 periplasmic sensor hybrid histidine kinase [Paraburkholderia hospita]OUL86741.1 hypothetical protein CA602_15075 [Paraburkholderia hospita]
MTAPDARLIRSAMSGHRFRVARQALTVSLVASILLPLICLCIFGSLDYNRRIANVDSALSKLSIAAQEHALRIFDLNAALTARTMDFLGNQTRDEIRQREPQIHRSLEAISSDYPQVASLSVFGPAGDLIASSRYSPPPAIAIADRDDFRSASHWRPHPYISLPLYRRIDGETVLATSIGRANEKGDSLGVISIALRRRYFIDFYSDLVDDDPGYAVGLYRREGAAILASSSPDAALGRLEHNREFRQAVRENVMYGSFTQPGNGQSDNLLVEFRRVGEYPVYVACTFALDELRGAWWRSLIVLAAGTLIPGAMICAWISFALIRLRADEAEWLRQNGDIARQPDAR